MLHEYRPIEGISVLRNNKKWQSEIPKEFGIEAAKAARRFHASLDTYEETPLIALGALAEKDKVNGIYVKDESKRFSLNAFKGLGGSYAMFRIFCEKFDIDPMYANLDYFKNSGLNEQIKNIHFVTATDGNHGRGVSWAASQFGCKSHVYMPKGSQEVRAQAIRDAGNAEVEITNFSYDDTVQFAKEKSETNGWILIQDTAWDGYEKIPSWIIEGYLTLAEETVQKMETMKQFPTHVFLQAGVGAMAGGILGYLKHCYGDKTKVIIVEPETVNCIYSSAEKEDGFVHSIGGMPKTIMAGLNCGTPCKVTWSILRDYADYYMSCSDWIAAEGMRAYANPLGTDPAVISGESGAVTFGAVNLLLNNKDCQSLRKEMGLNENANILLINTEGDTDPENYRRIVTDGIYPVPINKQ